jgi:hypothetical protein
MVARFWVAIVLLAQVKLIGVKSNREQSGRGSRRGPANGCRRRRYSAPNGGRETDGVAADQLVVIREGAGIVRRESFRRQGPA